MVHHLLMNYMMGNSISIVETQNLMLACGDDPVIRGAADMFYGLAIALNSKSSLDQQHAVQIMESTVRNLTESLFPNFQILVGAYMLDLYLKTGQFEKGLNVADTILQKIQETGIQGTFGRPEILRLKGELLFHLSDGDSNTLVEADHLVREAYTKSKEKGLRAIQLKSVLSCFRIWTKMGNSEALEEGTEMLKELCAFYDTTAKKHPSGDVQEARKLLAARMNQCS
jgi:hypothetical protein